MKSKTMMVVIMLLFIGTVKAITVPPKATPPKDSSIAIATNTINKKLLEQKLNRKLTGKEKVALFMYKHKLIPKKLLKKIDPEENEIKAKQKGRRSLTYSIIGWALVLIGGVATVPFLGLFGLGCFVVSIVSGIQSLHLQKKGNTNAVLGLVFSGLYFVLAFLAILLVLALLA